MFKLASFLGLLGLVVATLVIAWSGLDQVVQALGQAGWGIIWTSLAHLLPMAFCVVGWQALVPGKKRPSLLYFLYVLWIRAAVNNLMPVARIGGEIVAVRIMMKHGMRKSVAVASTVVETTVSVIGQFFFVLIGVGLFVMRFSDHDTTQKLLWGVVVSTPVIGALVFIQRVGAFGILTKLFTFMFRDKWKKFAGNTTQLDRAVLTMYRRQDRTIWCGFMQFMSWVACSLEIWLALYFLGHPLSLVECVMIEALIQATGSAAFIVPGAIGVQEAGFLLFGHFLGLTPDIAAALAVIRRCRDLLLYVPALLVWQAQEGHWLVQKHRKKKETVVSR